MPSSTPVIITPICISDGPVRTTGDDATCIPRACAVTLPSGYFVAGRQWRLTMSGSISNVADVPGSARFYLRLSGIPVWDSGAILLDPVNPNTALPWSLSALLTCRAGGESATVIGTGAFRAGCLKGSSVQPQASSVAMLPYASAPAVGEVFDTTVPLSVDVWYRQTSDRGSLTVSQYMIEELA